MILRIENLLRMYFVTSSIVVNIPIMLMELFDFVYHEKCYIDHESTNIATINDPCSNFQELLEKVRLFITKKITNMRWSISVKKN